MAGGNSYNGWPASDSASAIGVNTKWKVAGADYPGGIKAGDVETVFSYLVDRLHSDVEPMMTDPDNGSTGYGAWGYSYRDNVNNPGQLSCHASATAIDYNAPKHPNGTSTGPNGGGGWTGAQYSKIQQILAECSGVVRWLTSNDPMHFEISGSASAVASAAAKLPGIAPAPPTDPDPGYEDSEVENGMALSPQALDQITNLIRAELGSEATRDGGRALAGIKDTIRNELGPNAIENPDASLNAGIGKRARIDRAAEFASVPGYTARD